MSVDSRHPLYLEFDQDWKQLRDTYRGERIVKEAGFVYLPATSGMVEDGILNTRAPGFQAYAAYRMRARFPELVKEAVEAMLGVMHHKPPVIDLPDSMEPLRESATLRNESLEMLLRRINEEQLVTGRVGILLEVPEGTGMQLPLVALYRAEHMINWDEGERDDPELESLNFVSLDESDEERIFNFEWQFVQKHRVLILGEPLENEPVGQGVYRVGVFREQVSFSEADLVTPVVAGATLDQIPFVFINTKDIVPQPDEAPLLGLSNLTLTIYRGEADYRQALFLQGQDTLVMIGTTGSTEQEGERQRTGAGATIEIANVQGDAKYIGVNSDGLPEMRETLQNDYQTGNQKAGSLLEAVSRAAESGEALRVRVAARTASLNQIALAGAFGLQSLLRMEARWIGANPEEVVVTPNLDFVSEVLKGRDLVDLMDAKEKGAPLSTQSIHELLQARGLTELTFDEEMELLEAEKAEAQEVAEAAAEAAEPAAPPPTNNQEELIEV